MRRATIAGVNSRPQSNSSSRSRQYGSHHDADPPQAQAAATTNAPPPMEPSMTCMSVVEDGPTIAFACYDEERNEILLESCRASGCDTEAIVERFLQVAQPNLVLVGNKIINNALLLQMVTQPPPEVPGEEDEGEEENEQQQEQDTTNGDTNVRQPSQQQPNNGAMPSSSSIPYRLLKSKSFDVRACKALILQKLRVLSLFRQQQQQAQEHDAGYDDPHRNDRHFPPAAGSYAVFRPSSYHSLAALVDFDSKVQVQALGSLLSFLQTSIFRLEEAGTITINRIVHAKSSRYMHIAAATFSALHIFATEHHPLNVAKGGQGHSKEGFSLFSLLDRTKNKGGRQMLRQWMLKPLIDLQAITARQDFVELFMHPNLQTSVGVLLNLLGKVGPIDKILMRMQKCSTQPSDFLVLTRTLSSAVAISNALRNDILPRLENQGEQSTSTNRSQQFINSIFQRCNAQVLLDLQEQIAAIVDEEATNESKTSVVIREGFHEELDEWKEQYEYLEDTLEEVGAEIHRHHPELDNLSVVFVPQVGFLVALSKSMVVGNQVELPPDFTHIFNQDEEAFFKNTEMRELDQNIGDLDGLIKDTESMIVTELEESILDSENELRESFKALSELDCILAFAECAVDLNLTRPQMADAATNQIYIKDGRHPLQEIITEKEFIPNDVLIDDKDRLVVITGPNYSGKSCYLRQVGLLVYMAHIGSFIPCTEAVISLTDQICARICTVETCAVPQSSFQLDLTQMASILLKCTSNSLVLIDEFGKGTSPASGIAILGAALKKLSEIKCKTVCTTHFLELFSMNVIQDKVGGIKAQRMAIHLPKDDEDGASPLFKLEDGVASSSAGLICAKKAGVNHKVIARAKEIIRTMRERRQIQPLEEAIPQVELSSGEKDMLHFYFSVDSWESASEEELRTLIQKVARI